MLKNEFVVLAMLPFMLSACGGGSSSSSSTNTNENRAEVFSNGESKLFTYEVDLDFEQESIGFDKSEWSIQKGILHEKTKKPIFYAHYVTEKDGLYIPETEQTYNADRGIRDSFIHSMSSTKWVTTPYNKAGYKNLKFTKTLQEIDLQGLRVVDQFVPALLSMYEFEVSNGLEISDLNTLSSQLVNTSDTFPKGAKCIQTKTITSNEVFFEFEPDYWYEIPNARTLQDWANYELNEGTISNPVPYTETWGGIKIGSLLLDNISAPSTSENYKFALEYQSKVYQAFPQQRLWDNGEYIEYIKNEFMKIEWFNNVVIPLGKEKTDNFMALVDKKMRSQCNYYNAEAAKSVDSVLSKVRK
ncbi:hypothetical protein [Acinetobacter haemolyticus]|uniref:hypothetical protein n=1 Tax=Acinetobacter haemolyticus TaxID=29430 RepID=UPI003F561DDB